MSATEQAFARANGIRIHYQRSGGDHPPLVLAHGFSDNGACWASLVSVLRDEWDVIAYDARGHGRSDAPETGYGTDDRVADLLGLLDALGLEQPVLMGHSMGGQTVAWAAIAQPERPRAIVLEDSGIYAPGDASLRARAARPGGMPDWAEALRERTHEQLVKLCRRQSPDWPEEDLAAWAESKLQLSPHVASTFSGPHKDLASSWERVRCPVLFLKADAPEPVRAQHREQIAVLADARLVHIEGAGHNVRRDRHIETVRVLKEFLAEL